MANLIQSQITLTPPPANLHDLIGSDPNKVDFDQLIPLSSRDREDARRAWGCPGRPLESRVAEQEDARAGKQVLIALDTPWGDPSVWVRALAERLVQDNPAITVNYRVYDHLGNSAEEYEFVNGEWTTYEITDLNLFREIHGFIPAG